MVARVRATTANLALAGAPARDSHVARPSSADASAHLSSTLLSGLTLDSVGGTVSTHYQEPENKGEKQGALPLSEAPAKGCVVSGNVLEYLTIAQNIKHETI